MVTITMAERVPNDTAAIGTNLIILPALTVLAAAHLRRRHRRRLLRSLLLPPLLSSLPHPATRRLSLNLWLKWESWRWPLNL
jgi:hypothetical protein